jgi:hypothetical protein
MRYCQRLILFSRLLASDLASAMDRQCGVTQDLIGGPDRNRTALPYGVTQGRQDAPALVVPPICAT